jgi:hypothetical protein
LRCIADPYGSHLKAKGKIGVFALTFNREFNRLTEEELTELEVS